MISTGGGGVEGIPQFIISWSFFLTAYGLEQLYCGSVPVSFHTDPDLLSEKSLLRIRIQTELDTDPDPGKIFSTVPEKS